MCFKDKSGNKIILSRAYRYKSGTYYLTLNKAKEDRILYFDLVNNAGEVDFKMINLVTKEEINNVNLQTGVYDYSIKKDTSYRIVIVSKKTSGSCKITIK